MSLNGLDDPKILEVFTTVSAEPGGWLLLKYASRDEIELYAKGNGGVAEVRNAILQLEENGVLYGFLKYRRRNVVIKYLPPDTSRLIQARVAVHFNAVCERFAPNDTSTTIEIAEPNELRDSKLSAACSLHAASKSNTSSTSSLRRKRLGEIAEEEEEEQQREAKRRSVTEGAGLERGSEDTVTTPTSLAGPASSSLAEDPVRLNSDLATSPEQTKFSNTSTSELPEFLGTDDRPTTPNSIASSNNRRLSSQTTRTEVLSTYSYQTYGKPRVKLGPRPSGENAHRPQTAAGTLKPISSLPAGYKLFGKGSKKGRKENREEDAFVTSPFSDNALDLFPPPPADAASSLSPGEIPRPNTSSGVSTASTVMPAGSTKTSNSREKARLKKAMQLREKKKKISMLPPPPPRPQAEQAVVSDETAEADSRSSKEEPNGFAIDPAEDDVDDKRITMIKADSGVVMEGLALSAKAIAKGESTPQHEKMQTHLSMAPDATVQESVDHEKAVANREDHTKQLRLSQDPERMLLKPMTYDPTESSVGTAEPVEVVIDVNEEAASREIEVDAHQEKPTPGVPVDSTDTEEDVPAAPLEATQSTSGNEEGEDGPGLGITSANAMDEFDQQEGPELRLKSKRRPLPEPLRMDLTSNQDSRRTSVISYDDGLLEELQSATVEEARHMVVTKTPVTPVFPASFATASGPPPAVPSDPVDLSRPHTIRTVSNPVRGGLITPTDVNQSSSARSASSGAAYLHQVTQQQQQQQQGGNLSKKGSKMGTGITQRIKALELLSANPEPGHQPGSRPSSTFYAVGKSREPSRSPSVADRANSLRRQTPDPTSQARNPSPDALARRRERTGSMASRMSVFESPPGGGPAQLVVPSSSHSQRGQPESVSVTARIIRPSDNELEGGQGSLDFQQSQLFVDHHAAVTPPSEENQYMRERRPSQESRRTSQDGFTKSNKSRRSSLSVVKDFIKDRRNTVISSPTPSNLESPGSPNTNLARSPNGHHTSNFPNRLSFSSRRSSVSKDRAAADHHEPTISEGGDEDGKSTSGEKRQSRAGRFMRRISTLSSKSNSSNSLPKSSTNGTLNEADERRGAPSSMLAAHVNPRPATTTGSPQIVSHLGDVNVQFPDTLLWKRRNMCLDSQGFLVLSALPGAALQSGKLGQTSTKRFHLSQFRMPYTPDVEVEELPYSVVLDFVEGSGLQLACEGRSGQMKVLTVLQEAHSNQVSRFGV